MSFDASLPGVAALVFDEFHERHLYGDISLARALQIQRTIRPDLRIIVMSATLDGARVSALMEDCPVIESQGRAFPVETRHVSRDPRARIEEEVTRVVMTALRAEPGSLDRKSTRLNSSHT